MGTVGKTDLIDMVASHLGLPKTAVKSVVEATVEVIQARTAMGDAVRITGFGTFEEKTSAPRMGRNPRTGAPIEIAASRRLAFRAAKATATE